MKDYINATYYYEKTLQLRKKYLPVNHPLLAMHYSKIGSLYLLAEDYSQALLYYEMTLEVLRKVLPSDYPLLTMPYRNIATVHRLMGNDLLAQSYNEKAEQCNLFGSKP